MEGNNIQFKLLSLNVRGIRTFDKRKCILNWLNKQNADIYFLQETYSTVDVEDIWRTQWQGKLHFAHGSNHSCGVMVLVRSDLDLSLKSVNLDSEGRSIIMEAEVQSSLFLFVNIMLPTSFKTNAKFLTF